MFSRNINMITASIVTYHHPNSEIGKVVDCILTAKDGKMSAVLTLSGTGYGYLYMGTKEEAVSADQSSWIPYQVNEEGKYTYTVPVEALDKEFDLAIIGTKQKWYDHKVSVSDPQAE